MRTRFNHRIVLVSGAWGERNQWLRNQARKKNKPRSRLKRKKSNKGALIKGRTRDEPPWNCWATCRLRKDLKKIMRNYAGVYALYHGERLYYVGLTNDLYNRLRWHTKNRHKGKWNRFAIFRVSAARHPKRHGNVIATSREAARQFRRWPSS